MNNYPGAGLGIGTAIIGDTLGQTYPAGIVYPVCMIYGVLLTMGAQPVGEVAPGLASVDGSPKPYNSWRGAKVTAALTPADAISGRVITTDKITVETNEQGYFEIPVIRGLTVTVSCPVFGKPVSVVTAGLSSIDISTFF